MGKAREKLCYFVYFLVLIFLGGKLVGANFYAFCNYGSYVCKLLKKISSVRLLTMWSNGTVNLPRKWELYKQKVGHLCIITERK